MWCDVLCYFIWACSLSLMGYHVMSHDWIQSHFTLCTFLPTFVVQYHSILLSVCVGGGGFRWMSPERRGRIRGSTTEGCMRRRLPNSTGNLRGPPGTQQQQKHTLSHCHPEAKLGIAQSCELFKRLSCQQYRSDSCDSLTLSNLWKIIKTRMQFVFTLLQKCEDCQ